MCYVRRHLDNKILARLRVNQQFHGAAFEILLRSLFLRSGYELHILEDSSDDASFLTCEFNVRKEGREYSVEATSRMAGKSDQAIYTQLNHCLKKAIKSHEK